MGKRLHARLAKKGLVLDEETALRSGFAARERSAFEEAYTRYGGLLFSVAMNVLHSEQDAEDCVHDVLTRLWNRSRAYTVDRGQVRSFLVVCVRNEALSRRRSQQRRGRLAQRLNALAEPQEEFELTDFVERTRVREAIAQLPEDQRRALILAYYGGKTHVEIATELDEPLGTVKSRISMALRKLGAALTSTQASP